MSCVVWRKRSGPLDLTLLLPSFNILLVPSKIIATLSQDLSGRAFPHNSCFSLVLSANTPHLPPTSPKLPEGASDAESFTIIGSWTQYWQHLAILVSYGCCNKLPQTRWLNSTQIYFLTVLEARSLKLVSLVQNQNVGRARLPPQAPGENPFPCLL